MLQIKTQTLAVLYIYIKLVMMGHLILLFALLIEQRGLKRELNIYQYIYVLIDFLEYLYLSETLHLRRRILNIQDLYGCLPFISFIILYNKLLYKYIYQTTFN